MRGAAIPGPRQGPIHVESDPGPRLPQTKLSQNGSGPSRGARHVMCAHVMHMSRSSNRLLHVQHACPKFKLLYATMVIMYGFLTTFYHAFYRFMHNYTARLIPILTNLTEGVHKVVQKRVFTRIPTFIDSFGPLFGHFLITFYPLFDLF